MEREGEGPTRFVCWMRATELKIVSERERESRSPGEGEVAFYASKTDINHVSIFAFKYLNWRTCCLQSTHERIYVHIKQVH